MSNKTTKATPHHHHPLLVEGRPQPTCLRSVARRLGSAPTCAQATLTAMPAAPAVYAKRCEGQPAPPACCSRLSPAGFAVCPSRRSHTLATLSAPRTASHTQPPLWAWPDAGRTGAGRVGSSRRRALRYGRWAAACGGSSTGGGGVWAPLATLPGGRPEGRPSPPATTGARVRCAISSAP